MIHFRTWSAKDDVSEDFSIFLKKSEDNSSKHILTIGSTDLYLERSTEKFDINGVEIYEGDIVMVTNRTMIEVFGDAYEKFFTRKYVVLYENNQFKIKLHKDETKIYGWVGEAPVFDFPDSGYEDIEVVGSIMGGE